MLFMASFFSRPGLSRPMRDRFANRRGARYYGFTEMSPRRTQMSVHEHIEALRVKHVTLKHEIDEEIQRPHPDDLRITELKRQKLRIKDEIASLETAD
jgi:hypothetical protein